MAISPPGSETMRLLTVAAISVCIAIVLGFLFFQNTTEPPQIVQDRQPPLLSREWMEYAEDIVRQTKPTPPESSRLYAYVATAYADTLAHTDSPTEASVVVRDVLNTLVPRYVGTTTQFFMQKVGGEPGLSDEAEKVREDLLARARRDGASIAWDGTRPEGTEYWEGKNPFSPNAGSWERWVTTSEDTFNIPPPPAWGSEEHKAALSVVKNAAAARTPEQRAAINFWGGVPGTEAPAGIWQNRLFHETKTYDLSDQEYAYAQKVLAQTLADAFMECWKVKYTYWTRRPSMDDSTIDLAMNNPPFPSYLSGHSTISRAAAEVLGVLFPEKHDRFIADAEEARNSRLWAGIHFEYDNNVGFSLGERVGKVVTSRMNLTALR